MPRYLLQPASLIIDRSGYYYVAGPYTDPSHLVREERCIAHIRGSIELARKMNIFTLSPIAHSHKMDYCGNFCNDKEYWLELDGLLIRSNKCLGIIVLMLPGWEKSEGTAWEIKLCYKVGKPPMAVEWPIGDKPKFYIITDMEEEDVTTPRSDASGQVQSSEG